MVALETTLLVHGVPTQQALPLFDELTQIVRDEGGSPALVGVVQGRAVVGMTRAQLTEMLARPDTAKANTANLGLLLHAGKDGATTVSGTMELACAAGLRVFATGGIGGVHRGYGTAFDVSADLAAFTRFPVAVVTSGVKSILDVVATREVLETLGVPVIGVGTDCFPAFYLRESDAGVDARFDDVEDLARFVDAELRRTGRGIVLAHPIPAADAIAVTNWERWLAQAQQRVALRNVTGRAVTPALLAELVRVSDGATLRANLALIRANTRFAARLSAAMRAI